MSRCTRAFLFAVEDQPSRAFLDAPAALSHPRRFVALDVLLAFALDGVHARPVAFADLHRVEQIFEFNRVCLAQTRSCL